MSKVTVMMPVFNGSQFIAEAIETVRAQTFDDWELLVVDDGSTDNTLEIVKTFADGRINILCQDHQGEGAARNTALRAAAGDYIAFLDADDWFLPDALSLFVAYLDHNPDFDAFYSDGFKCDVDGQTLARFSDTKPSNPVGNVLEDMTIHPLHGGVCATAFRKNFAQKHGLWFDESLKLATDWDFFIRMAEHGHFGYIAEPTCRYRLHAASISATLPDDRRHYHAIIQLRIIEQPYFADFALTTKWTLFYQLLLLWLWDHPQRQQSVFDKVQFRDLPAESRAELLRLVASKYILDSRHIDFATLCLQKSVALDPAGMKQKILFRAVQTSPELARSLLTLWQGLLATRPGRFRGSSVERLS